MYISIHTYRIDVQSTWELIEGSQEAFQNNCRYYSSGLIWQVQFKGRLTNQRDCQAFDTVPGCVSFKISKDGSWKAKKWNCMVRCKHSTVHSYCRSHSASLPFAGPWQDFYIWQERTSAALQHSLGGQNVTGGPLPLARMNGRAATYARWTHIICHS